MERALPCITFVKKYGYVTFSDFTLRGHNNKDMTNEYNNNNNNDRLTAFDPGQHG